ncbi:MAG TPA: aspartyl protease family protein [Candidatus Bathyarchaeia archaeon]|nr:aspartyl protease family protein [Candidatus Bathyarchaeia archaeon]
MNPISKRYLVPCLLIGTLFWVARYAASRGGAKQKSQATAASMDTEIAFELVGGRIYVPAVVNGHATMAIVDTGAAASIMDLALADQWNLPSSGAASASGGGSSAVPAKILRDTNVRIGDVEEQVEYAVPLTSLASFEGRPLDVIIGARFFSHRIVEIDYPRRRLRISGASGNSTSEVTLPIRFSNGLPHIRASLVVGNKTYDLDALLDTGASATTLTNRFLREHPLDVPTTAKTVTGGGVGGSTEGRYLRPELLRLSGIELRQPVLIASEAQSGADGLDTDRDLVLGSSVLQRFRVIIDYSHKRVTMIPNPQTYDAFEVDKSGLRIVAEGPDLRVFKVAGVLEKSSSETAGIRPGDVIESIDGVESSRYRLWELRELFRTMPAAGAWHLSIRRDSSSLPITLPARNIT